MKTFVKIKALLKTSIFVLCILLFSINTAFASDGFKDLCDVKSSKMEAVVEPNTQKQQICISDEITLLDPQEIIELVEDIKKKNSTAKKTYILRKIVDKIVCNECDELSAIGDKYLDRDNYIDKISDHIIKGLSLAIKAKDHPSTNKKILKELKEKCKPYYEIEQQKPNN